jgi:hypothetical protein
MREPWLKLVITDLMVAGGTLRTFPAPADKGHRNSVSPCPSGHLLSHFFHNPCKLVAGHMGNPDIRIVPHPPVPVTAADPAGLDANHHRIIDRNWIRDVLNAQRLTKRFVNSRLHKDSLNLGLASGFSSKKLLSFVQ